MAADSNNLKVKSAGIRINPQEIDVDLILKAIASIEKGGHLDVLVNPSPSSVTEAEKITRKLYAYAPSKPSDLNYTVLLASSAHADKWEREFGVNSTAPPSSNNDFLGKYHTVAVGGTWDHMHWGHRLMLTMAAYTSQSTVVIGVTSSELLVNKKYAEALESYESRCQAAKEFVNYLCPNVKVDTYPLDNMYGPTITVEGIEALVVSAETSKGGSQVNDKRHEMNWPSLDIIEVGLIPGLGDEKLSSTQLRQEHLEKKANKI